MMVRLDKRQQSEARHQLLTNVVWAICNDTLRRLQHEGRTNLAPVEVFLSARWFCDTILGLSDIDEGIDYEMDDLEGEAEGENDAMLVMMLATALLQAQGKRQGSTDCKKIILRIYERWNDRELFVPLLGLFADKEAALLESRRIDLYTYELNSLEKEVPQEDGYAVVASIVDAALGLSVEGMQHVENTLSEVNDKFGHRYQADLDRMREARKKKSVSSINIDRVNDIHDNPNVTIGSK